jgi:hypothetical protein
VTITVTEDELTQRIAEAIAREFSLFDARLQLLEARPVLKDGGVWMTGRTYDAGDIVSHGGSAWLCSSAHVATGPSPHPDCFRLLVKHGRDKR